MKGEIDELYRQVVSFWDLLSQTIPELKEVTVSSPSDELASKYRNDDGGHLLFRLVGMRAFAQAAKTLLDRGQTLREVVTLLSKTSLTLNKPPWSGVLWNSHAHKMINKNGKLSHNLLLYMGRKQLEPESYPLLDEYRKALGDDVAALPQ